MCLSTSDIIDLAVGTCSCIAATVAICLTKKEIKIQNKRSLFEKRLNNLIGCRTIYESVEESLNIIDKIVKWNKNSERLELHDLFYSMLGHGFLRKGRKIADNSLCQEHRETFLKIVENIRNMSDKCRILFDGDEKMIMCDFLESYRNILMTMLDYQTLMDDNKNFPLMAKYPDEIKCMKSLKKYSNVLIDNFNRIKDGEILKKMYDEIRI